VTGEQSGEFCAAVGDVLVQVVWEAAGQSFKVVVGIVIVLIGGVIY